ncbi:nucleotide exchange factor GrpE [Skermania sp. ID1734]|uniref:nucleotide exchange factor GrpE n=1 Tax=Skermania sp. ID1734 TaxID=2597516 RepID=UPI00117E0486|nr:nucleotide exchange factor GrpE [Skermania sp. ID1734]TSE00466.1 nucleotide exchange factor GrpE [Skermania sp. ID1734]
MQDPNEPITFVDKRKIDPETGEVREAYSGQAGHDAEPVEPLAGTGSAPQPGPVDEPAVAEAAAVVSAEANELAERTADLQRLTAEYANYRRRADRERAAERERSKAAVVMELLPVIDDLDRARAHGDLESGPLRSVADKLSAALNKLGLSEFGTEGEAFDPTLHEAVQHEGEGHDPVIGTVFRKGYRIGDRVLRHAMVAVTDGVSDLVESEPDGDSQQ